MPEKNPEKKSPSPLETKPQKNWRDEAAAKLGKAAVQGAKDKK